MRQPHTGSRSRGPKVLAAERHHLVFDIPAHLNVTGQHRKIPLGFLQKLRSAPPHTGSPGPKESGKSTPGQGPKRAQRVRPGVSKESEKSLKSDFRTLFGLFRELRGALFGHFCGLAPGYSFSPDSFRTLPGFRARRARETLCGARLIAMQKLCLENFNSDWLCLACLHQNQRHCRKGFHSRPTKMPTKVPTKTPTKTPVKPSPSPKTPCLEGAPDRGEGKGRLSGRLSGHLSGHLSGFVVESFAISRVVTCRVSLKARNPQKK